MAESMTFREALARHLGWREHLDHGLKPDDLQVDSWWDQGWPGTDVTAGEPAAFAVRAMGPCPCGTYLYRQLLNEQVADFLSAVSRP